MIFEAAFLAADATIAYLNSTILLFDSKRKMINHPGQFIYWIYHVDQGADLGIHQG